jgi:hypothetical protein
MKCPNPDCGHNFTPWRVWAINRWHCIKCPACQTNLTYQSVGVKSMLIRTGLFIVAAPIGLLAWSLLPWYLLLLAAFVFVLLGYVVDVFTVQLAEACDWRGWVEGYRDL